MKKTLKRILVAVLTLIIFLGVCPTSASAASASTCTTINSFGAGTALNYTQYDLLRTGKISAEKIKGTWYYKFTKNHDTLYVKTTAFSNGVGNDFSPVNNALTKGVMRKDGVAEKYSFTYKARTSTSQKLVEQCSAKQTNIYNKTTLTTYETYFSWLTVIGNRVEFEVDLECKKNGHVLFTYQDKINMKYALKNGYKEPSTATEYMMALKRNTTNGVVNAMIPTFELDITKPGTNCVKLNSCLYRGKGIANTKKSLSEFIEIAVSVGEVVKDLVTASLPFKSLFGLYSQAGTKLVKKSNEYVSNDKTYLSWSKNIAVKAKFKSPISLKTSGDYFRTEVRLSATPSYSGTKTQMQVVFSVKSK